MKCTRFFTLLALLFAVTGLTSACAPITANRGNLLEDDRLTQIKAGETDQAGVQRVLGPPTVIGTFDKNNWYYSGKRTERTAFFKPDTLAERTVMIRFNEAGIVDQVVDVAPDTQIAVKPESRITPTTGRAMNVVDQLIENAGRPGLPSSGSRRQPGTVGGPGRVGR